MILSLYAVYVEYKMEHPSANDDEPFTALCDIKAIGASCSKVFSLPQGRMLSYLGLVPKASVLDLPNAALGILHYAYLIFSSALSMPKTLTSAMVAMSLASSILLAYQLTFVLHDLCVLCWSAHVINAYLFYDHFWGRSSSQLGGVVSKTTKPKAV